MLFSKTVSSVIRRLKGIAMIESRGFTLFVVFKPLPVSLNNFGVIACISKPFFIDQEISPVYEITLELWLLIYLRTLFRFLQVLPLEFLL